MGKVKKGRGSKKIPLDVQIYESETVKPTGRTPKFKLRQEESEYIDNKLSVKILEQARIQQEELEEEVGSGSGTKPKKTKTVKLSKDTSDSEESELEENDDYFYEDIEINEEDEKALEMFMGKDPPARITLADIIMEKITERKTELASRFSDAASVRLAEMDERVVKMYRGVGEILSKYRSGKIPKAFKIIPSLSNWEQVLYLTEPTNWTAAAMYQGTRLFASNLKEKMAQRFYNLVLLPRIRDDIMEYKKLNFHLFQALRKALYKPGAFFKGIILPMCEAGDCTLREATIFSSVIAKNSIPVLHSSAAMLKIAEMEYSGANSIFLRILVDKKYALPFRVVDAVVYHFLRFQTDKRMLPVLWHQSFLTFVQRYKEDISSEQKEALLDLLRVHYHPQITKEIRRELQHSKCRDDQPTSMVVN